MFTTLHLTISNKQVREKLTDSEYKEFVGSMKALKSNTMKISHALESIARLFCLPDRLSLLHRYELTSVYFFIITIPQL